MTIQSPDDAASAPTPVPTHEARAGDRGDASGRNLAQSRAIGQDDPIEEGSRQGRERDKKTGFPGTPDIGTDAVQTEEARALEAEKDGRRVP
jgi:hypothetical protein